MMTFGDNSSAIPVLGGALVFMILGNDSPAIPLFISAFGVSAGVAVNLMALDHSAEVVSADPGRDGPFAVEL